MHAMGIDDAYHVERVLASGAGGITELVTLDGSGPFVRKRIPSKLARRGVWGTLAECACARLPHVEASYEMPDEFVVVCDYVPGQNLEQLVATRGRLPEGEARQVVAQLCEAAAALHAHGIIHRDISPRNVVVAADGAHLIDLGIARFRSAGATHDTTQLGTPGFASPEQHGFAQTDARSDVYSLGRVLGYLLTGVLPDVPEAAEYERTLGDPGVVRPEARAIVERACAMEPSARYQSAEELAAALAGEKNVGPTAPAPAMPPTFEPAPRRRSWLKVLLAVMAAVAFVAAVAIILVQTFGASEKDADVPAADLPAVSAPAADDEPAGGEASAAEVPELEIVESGWSVDAQGYVHYAFGLHNPSDVWADMPGVSITGRDTDGRVIFSAEQYISGVPAGQTTYFGSQAGDCTPPTTVEFRPIALEEYQVGAGSGTGATYEVKDARAVSDGLGGIKFVGEVTNVHDGEKRGGMGDVALTVVLRDASGAIVYGSTGYASNPAEGESSSFEILTYGVPDYASFEVYAQPW